ncbi:MAG: lipid-A-disaccharide synthase [Ignavibacteriaceae bacterium]
MKNLNKNILIIAGEASGDLHGASLVKELRKIDNAIKIFGIGGDKMEAAGMELIYHINKMAFLGFVEVLKHLPFIRKVQKDLIQLVKEKNIRNAVLIDYPGFNLSIAKKLKKLNLKIVYYISPQIWAWGAGRIKKIRNLVNKMLVVFPFEENFYRKSGIDVEFVGHPLLERIEDYTFLTKNELFLKFGLEQEKEILLILPGSRLHEVEKIFPESIKAAKKISEEFNMQIVVACAPNIDDKIFNRITGANDFKVVKGYTYDFLKNAKIGIVKSGTSTLEAALFELPIVIVYKTSFLTYIIGKKLIKVGNIGMVNIVAGEKVAPELIQDNVSQEKVYTELKKILSDKDLLLSIKKKMSEIKTKLGTIGASERAAKIIYRMLNEA